jgi:SAM-dependent methyltransferase
MTILSLLNRNNRRQQTLSSFDYQWRCLSEGDGMLSDAWFKENVCQILTEFTGVAPAWFQGKRVLDAGSGNGRWSYGLLKLGANVMAVDFSESGLERTKASCEFSDQLETAKVNLLDPPKEIRGRRFDMVYSFGVLHHTGDTFTALRNVADLVADDGLIFLYLYGSASWSLKKSIRNNWVRVRLAGLTFDEKIETLRQLYPERDPHQCFDLLSPVINERLKFDDVKLELERLGFVDVVQTIRSTELFIRARRPGFKAMEHLINELPVHSIHISHYAETDRLRRDIVYERRYWEMAARLTPPGPGRGSAGRAKGKLDVPTEALRGRRALVICPDSPAPAREIAAAGAHVTLLYPSEQCVRDTGPQPDVLIASTLSEPEEGEPEFDFIYAPGSTVIIARNPELALKRLASRLAPGGELYVETLAPEPETLSHKVRRGLLKSFKFEKKIEKLLSDHPDAGLDEAFSLLSPRLPARFSAERLKQLMSEAGLEDVACVQEERRLLARARKIGRN